MKGRGEECGRARPLWIISGRWRTPGSTVQAAPAAGHHCAPSSAAPTPGSHPKSKLEWFHPWNCPTASRDTFGDVFSRLDPVQQCFMAWTPVSGSPGKWWPSTARHSHDRNVGKRAIHLVSAWALSCGAGEDRGEVQRNHRDPPLPMLELKGWIDAICQQEIAQGILDRGAAGVERQYRSGFCLPITLHRATVNPRYYIH